jgi:hypothetical protein
MTNRSREERLKEEVERFISAHPLREEHRNLIRSFLAGDIIEEESAQVTRDFVDEYVRVLRGLAAVTPDLQKEVSEALRSARLAPNEAFAEAVLHRLADDPVAAIRHIEVADAATTKRNSLNARSPRVSVHDWWSVQIGDCVEGQSDVMPSEVREYLLQIEGVSFGEGVFRYAGQDKDSGLEIEPISNAQLRSKTYAAKKRYRA